MRSKLCDLSSAVCAEQLCYGVRAVKWRLRVWGYGMQVYACAETQPATTQTPKKAPEDHPKVGLSKRPKDNDKQLTHVFKSTPHNSLGPSLGPSWPREPQGHPKAFQKKPRWTSQWPFYWKMRALGAIFEGKKTYLELTRKKTRLNSFFWNGS